MGDTPYSFLNEQDEYPLMEDNSFVIAECNGLVLPVIGLLSMIAVLMFVRRPVGLG